MDLATVMTVVQTILTAIQTLDQFKAICSFTDCKRRLADLQSTVDTVKSVLQDAEAKQDSLNNQEKKYIEELKDAIYDANDVVDEFITLVKRKQNAGASDKVSDKVASFFSRFQFLTHNLSSKVKEVNMKLDGLASRSSKFSFKVDGKPVTLQKEDTCSFVSSNETIIGRDKDVEKIVGMILDSDDVDQPDVSFLAIVGMGGMGKTALAQLVYNDPRVTSAFQLKKWTCISDHDQDLWNLTKLLGKVVKEKLVCSDLTSLEQMQKEVREQLEKEKYLLVLDDVWTESYHRWQQFEEFFKIGKNGSRIVITTRSRKTAQMVASGRVHELRGLSEEKSWCLFERMAFLPEQRETPDDDLVTLGKKIIEKCANVPLAIRVMGSLLRGESKAKWLSFEEKGLSNISESDNTMNNVLRLSYHQLNSPLKSCFAYCAIFPKDREIGKQMLISLWLAQGYIKEECVGDEYFLILLRRCFFQDVRKDECGEIENFKIHDLIHDMAEQVAGEEIYKLNSCTLGVGRRVHHLSRLYHSCSHEIIFDRSLIRTYLQIKEPWSKGYVNQLLMGQSITNWTCLRSLDLSGSCDESLPESIGKLIHLRYLDLSRSSNLKMLPRSITKLINLQTLDLYECTSLKELPKDVSNLVELSTLDVTSSKKLSQMPSGMGMLTRLHTLGLFVVGRGSSDEKHWYDGLEDLRSLNNLKGYLKICIRVDKSANYVKENHGGGSYLKSKEHLKKIYIDFTKEEGCRSVKSEQNLLEELQPHHDLRELRLEGYHGERMPRWPGREEKLELFYLPNLFSLQICDCQELRSLPPLEKLPHLKKLALEVLPNLEYLVNVNPDFHASGEEQTLFPCLEELRIRKLGKLKGWWPTSALIVQNEHLIWEASPGFAQLKTLQIIHCSLMKSIPICSHLETLHIEDSCRCLKWSNMTRSSKQKVLTISHLEWLMSIPTDYFQGLEKIVIQRDNKVESLADVCMLFHSDILSSLRSIQFESCPKLRSAGGWLEKLFGLHSLWIEDCPHLLDGIRWENLSQSLQRLTLVSFTELEELPEGMKNCRSLQSLMIRNCLQLRFLPNWMPKLTSLQKLTLQNCSRDIEERCQKPDGEDWSLIQHMKLFCILEEKKTNVYSTFYRA